MPPCLYDVCVRIELRDEQRARIGRIEVDPSQRPTRAVTQDTGREVFLNWDTALDDAGQVRQCVVCGCHDLFHEKAFPQITGLVVVLAFIGAVLGITGLATELPVLIIMSVVLALDVAILIFSRRRLVCYNCRTTYHNLPIARYHRRWDRARADRYQRPAPSAAALPAGQSPEAGEKARAAASADRAAPPPSPANRGAAPAPSKGYFA